MNRIPFLRALSIAFMASVVCLAGSGQASADGAPPSQVAFAIPSGAASIADPPAQVAEPSVAQGATLAGIVAPVDARSRPDGGRSIWMAGAQTLWSHEPQVLLVLGSAVSRGRQWLHVLLPIRPNDTTGWIPRDNVKLLRTDYWVTVSLGSRRVDVYRSGHRVRSFRAVIGKSATPTPGGLAAIYEKNRQPDPTEFLGPWVLTLTSFSDVLHSFEGGPGRVAIHGRDGASLLDPLGSAASHGCIRIDNAPVTWMAQQLPQGTPVQIRS